MLSYFSTKRATQTPISDVAIGFASPPKAKKISSAEAFDDMARVIRRDVNFTKNELLRYAEAALSPLDLPSPVIEEIHACMGDDSAILQTFFSRLSVPARADFKNHYSQKAGLVFNESSASPALLLNQARQFLKIPSEISLVSAVLRRKFPADFALYLFPEFENMKRIISNKILNRPSSYSLFTQTFEERLSTQLGDLTYTWFEDAKELQIKSWIDGPWELLTFHYSQSAADAQLDNLLTVQSITYEPEGSLDISSVANSLLELVRIGSSINRSALESRHIKVFNVEVGEPSVANRQAEDIESLFLNLW